MKYTVIAAPPIAQPTHGGVPATAPMIDPIAQSWPARMNSDPSQRMPGGQRADGGAVTVLEIVADRAELVRRGLPPHRGTNPEREHDDPTAADPTHHQAAMPFV